MLQFLVKMRKLSYGGNLGDCVGCKVNLVINQTCLGVQVEETEVSRISTGSEGDYLFRRTRIGFKKLGNQKIDCRSANIRSCADQP